MSISLKTVGIIVKDMATTIAFYRTLGLPIPQNIELGPNVEYTTPQGVVLGFLTEELARAADPEFQTPGPQSLNLQFGCDTPDDVDATFTRLTSAGYESYAEPWDAFWGQRFARAVDPDGRIVNIFADLSQ